MRIVKKVVLASLALVLRLCEAIYNSLIDLKFIISKAYAYWIDNMKLVIESTTKFELLSAPYIAFTSIFAAFKFASDECKREILIRKNIRSGFVEAKVWNNLFNWSETYLKYV